MQTHPDNQELRSHDIAYACFTFSGGAAFLMGILSLTPMNTGVSGGIGILIGVPLSIAAIVAMFTGLFYSIIHYKHLPFDVMSIASILFILEMITELGPVAVYNISPIIYGIITLAFGLLWVTRLRKKHVWAPCKNGVILCITPLPIKTNWNNNEISSNSIIAAFGARNREYQQWHERIVVNAWIATIIFKRNESTGKRHASHYGCLYIGTMGCHSNNCQTNGKHLCIATRLVTQPDAWITQQITKNILTDGWAVSLLFRHACPCCWKQQSGTNQLLYFKNERILC